MYGPVYTVLVHMYAAYMHYLVPQKQLPVYFFRYTPWSPGGPGIGRLVAGGGR